MNFKNHAIVKCAGRHYQCICADKGMAVFAYMPKGLNGGKVNYERLFAVSNRPEFLEIFKHELILEGGDS